LFECLPIVRAVATGHGALMIGVLMLSCRMAEGNLA